MSRYECDLDAYETGEWPAPSECRECAGSGWYRQATWTEPAEWCEACEGTGVIDCTCPGDCPLPEHDRHLLPPTPHEPCETCHGEGEVV